MNMVSTRILSLMNGYKSTEGKSPHIIVYVEEHKNHCGMLSATVPMPMLLLMPMPCDCAYVTASDFAAQYEQCTFATGSHIAHDQLDGCYVLQTHTSICVKFSYLRLRLLQ